MKNLKTYNLFLESLLNDKTPSRPNPNNVKSEHGLVVPDLWFGEAIKLIKRDCKPFLEELDKNPNLLSERFLMRGVQKVWENDEMLPELRYESTSPSKSKFYRNTWRYRIAYKEVRQDREPRDTAYGVSDAFDEEFEKKFNISPRMKGVFTTGNENTASQYGQPFLVFPIGEYKYVWSPTVKDLFNKVDGNYWYRYLDFPEGAVDEFMELEEGSDVQGEYGIDWYKEGMSEEEINNHLSEDARNQVESIVSEYKDTDLEDGIKSGNEITFVCDSYYIVTFHQKIVDEFYRRS
ncbi:MAG: putative chorismate mutase-like protein [uncultured marine phage]|uniref:Putative chorismate mutase-like protein n=1 Tax=uncultured marine phage TaxID=707152 RepID=A0A8D9C940_9VIRU|nr:MAG: putative chorismate mutase-like protein [uncultured marine phage]